jgi:hypothetical protein
MPDDASEPIPQTPNEVDQMKSVGIDGNEKNTTALTAGVAVGAAVVIGLVAGFFIFRQRRQRSQPQQKDRRDEAPSPNPTHGNNDSSSRVDTGSIYLNTVNSPLNLVDLDQTISNVAAPLNEATSGQNYRYQQHATTWGNNPVDLDQTISTVAYPVVPEEVVIPPAFVGRKQPPRPIYVPRYKDQSRSIVPLAATAQTSTRRENPYSYAPGSIGTTSNENQRRRAIDP